MRPFCHFIKILFIEAKPSVSCFETGGPDILPRAGNYVQPDPHARIV